ncbi:MAG: RNA polymerase sigma factor [Planctomycetota bacterium]
MNQESKQPQNDAELASAFSAEEPALRRLLWGLLREAAAVDDVLQTTFLRFLQHRPERPQHRPERPPAQKPDSAESNAQRESLTSAAHSGNVNPLRAWLFRVATNEALLVKRKLGTQARHLEGLAWLQGMSATLHSSQASPANDPHQVASAAEQQRLVKQHLAKLPEEHQTIVRMRIYENLKFAEIAEKLNLPLGTVLTRMRSALHAIKTGLENLK